MTESDDERLHALCGNPFFSQDPLMVWQRQLSLLWDSALNRPQQIDIFSLILTASKKKSYSEPIRKFLHKAGFWKARFCPGFAFVTHDLGAAKGKATVRKPRFSFATQLMVYWIDSLMYWINSLMYLIHPNSSPDPDSDSDSDFNLNTNLNPNLHPNPNPNPII